MTSRYHPDWVDDAIAESALRSAKAVKRGSTTDELLARAILAERTAERERCAMIPRRVIEDEGVEDAATIEICNLIVDAIRKGDPT